jgi:flavin reductase (DIM6/NTAB) family NADH-FMN oxidoreductase RutF
MAKQALEPFAYLPQFMKLLVKPGALLTTLDQDGRPNIMTIGWSQVGVLWNRPVCLAYVRPSRHSFTCLEQVRQFTVNLVPPSLAKAAALCGSKSGRELDKFAAAKLAATPGQKVKPPSIEAGILHYECNVVHYNDLLPLNLRHDLIDACYPGGDFHRLYFGEIVACYGDPDALKKL